MKAYFSFMIVVLSLFLFLNLFIMVNPVLPSHRQTEEQRDFYLIQDLSRSVEESSATGAKAALVLYLTMKLSEENPSIDIEELNEFVSKGALLAVQQLEINKLSSYDLFCVNREFDEKYLEEAMVKDSLLEIPGDARHFSYASCENTIRAEVSLPPLGSLSNSSLEEVLKASEITLYISNPEYEYGLLAYSFYDNGVASSSILNPRHLYIKPEPIEVPEFLIDNINLLSEE